jgi:hypothetical protein
MAAYTPVLCARTGGGNIGALAGTPANGDTFPAGPNNFLYVQNGNAAAVTVIVTPPTGGGPLGTTVGPFTLSPAVEATTGVRIFGPFPPQPFADSAGNVTVSSYSVTATVKAACLQMSTS